MHDELLATLIVWISGSCTTGVLLRWDRRRLTPNQRRQMWNDATLYLAVSGLFLPAPLTFGAHVWVTRSGPLWKRLLMALLGSMLSVTLSMVVASLLLMLFGIE